MTLPLLLALASTLASSPLVGDAPAPRSPAPAGDEPAPSPPMEPPDTSYVDDLLKELPSGAARERKAPGFLKYALLEGMFAVWSAFAASYPEATGWTMVGVSPLSFM